MAETSLDPSIPTENVTQISDVDVLCGRGGAALRHPGNQTYRRLVNLNKGLYITCLKTEKLKISRSIVAAIREQKGRFLEKDAKSNTWYDIGDKKAVEKTSQALREGQPKLRQKIVEMGGGAAGAASLMERQYGASAGIYPEQVGLNTAPPPAQSSTGHPHPGMQPPMNMTEAEMMQRLNLNGNNAHTGGRGPQPQHMHNNSNTNNTNNPNANNPMRGSGDMGMAMMSDYAGGYRTSTNPNHHMGMPPPAMAAARARGMDGSMGRVMMDHSQNSTSNGSNNNNNNNNHDILMYGRGAAQPSQTGSSGFVAGRSMNEGQQPMPNMGPPPNMVPSSGQGRMPFQNMSMADRHQLFARMNQGGSSHAMRDVSGHSFGDGMPEIYMVESQHSLMSNITDHRSSHMAGQGVERKPIRTQDDIGIGSSHSRGSNAMDLGSRHSIMSGLSKISDTSIDASIFSDLSRKIGNVSTRSFSEVSGLDLAIDARLMDQDNLVLFDNDVERLNASEFDD